MEKTRIGVLRGGPSNEYDVSLESGQNVIDHFPESYDIHDVLIGKSGQWHVDGVEMTPEKVMRRVDGFFNALHGAYGEDGLLQRILDQHQFVYTGSGALSSAVSMNKLSAKNYFEKSGVKTPRHVSFDKRFEDDKSMEEIAEQRMFRVVRDLPNPWVGKPISGGSSLGVTMLQTTDELYEYLLESLRENHKIFVEEKISGTEATAGVLENWDEKEIFSLPPIEISPEGGEFFDYKKKYDGTTKETAYGSFSPNAIHDLKSTAASVHRILDLRHYSRTDAIVTDNDDVYVLEVNTLPGLTEKSLYPNELGAAEIEFSDFLDHVMQMALRRKRYLR